jgi:hypothetical protein
MNLEPGLPSMLRIPPGRPDGVVEADHKEIDVVGRARQGRDPLGGVVEDCLGMDLEPGLPSMFRVPPGRPDSVVEADHKEIDMVRRARQGRDPLGGVVESWRPVIEVDHAARRVVAANHATLAAIGKICYREPVDGSVGSARSGTPRPDLDIVHRSEQRIGIIGTLGEVVTFESFIGPGKLVDVSLRDVGCGITNERGFVVELGAGLAGAGHDALQHIARIDPWLRSPVDGGTALTIGVPVRDAPITAAEQSIGAPLQHGLQDMGG